MDSSGAVNDYDAIKRVLDERGYEPVWGKPRAERLTRQICPRTPEGGGICTVPCDLAENCYIKIHLRHDGG